MNMTKILIALLLAFLVYIAVDALIKIVYWRVLNFNQRRAEIQKQNLLGYKGYYSANKKKKQRLPVPEKIRIALIRAGIQLKPEEFLSLWIGLAVLISFLMIAMRVKVATAGIVLLCTLLVPPIIVSIKSKKRKEKFSEQLKDALMVLSNSLRAGFTFEQAISSVSYDLPDPIGTEFKQVFREIELGDSMGAALDRMAERMESKDLEMVNVAVAIQKKVGGNLATILDNISETLRERMLMKKKINALTAQGRMSGIIISLLPICLLLAITVINPDYMEPMWTTTYGHLLLSIALILEIIGYVVIRKMIDIKL
ncbi:tight adherence protein B [Tindallia californiensis]|uniref:Tight adherence protein B n=2 Tax=Tindallia californiensis TaxID=159292 RepID=A0A1H3M6J7_9FIRM|nr:tight adherence protein B [Tindallia californiensis]